MPLHEIFTTKPLGSCLALAATLLLAAGSSACMGTASASAEAGVPAPGLVSIGPDVWVEGEADAPDAYYTSGYYWRVEDDHWYRRPRPEGQWVIVETRVVPERVVVHEREHHAAIAQRHPAVAARIAADRERERDREEKNEHREAAEQLKQARANEARERKDRQQDLREAREKVADQREADAKRREQAIERREKSEAAADRREDNAQERARRAEQEQRKSEKH